MNNKGAFGVILFFIVVIFVVTGFGVYTAQEKGIEYNITNLNWSNYSINSEGKGELFNIASIFVNALGEITFEITNLSQEFIQEHPNLPYNVLMWTLVFALILYIAVPLIKVGLIAGIFIKDLIQSRRERKEIKRLRDEKNVKNNRSE